MNVIKEDILGKDDLLKIYRILKVYNEGLIINPSEDWEVDTYEDIITDKKGLDTILEKIEELLPFNECEKIKKQILRRRYDTFNNEIDESAYEKIEKAFNQQKTVEIGYFDMKSAEIKTREIDIYWIGWEYCAV